MPHLAFIRLPINGDEQDILLHPVSKDASWRPMPDKRGFFTLSEEWHHLLEEKHWAISRFCDDAFPKVPAMASHIEIPHQALHRARHGFFGVRDGIHSWADFQDYTHAAQRGFLELEAFWDWWVSLQDVVGSSWFVLVPHRLSRGLLVQNLDIFEECCHCNVATFIEVPANKYELDEDLYVLWAPQSRLCSMTLHTTDPRKSKHNKELWYYPPIIKYLVDFEGAVRGYVPQEDVL